MFNTCISSNCDKKTEIVYSALCKLVSPFEEGTIIDLLYWLNKFTIAFNLLQIDEKTVLLLFPSFLKGFAKLQYSTISNRSRKKWRKTVIKLVDCFRSQLDWILAGEEIATISQGSSTIAEYSAKLDMIGSIAYGQLHEKCKEKLLVFHFVKNSRRELKSKLLLLNPIPDTLKEIVVQAENIQKFTNVDQEACTFLKNVNISNFNYGKDLIAAIDVAEIVDTSEQCFFHIKRSSDLETVERYVKSEVSLDCSSTYYKFDDVKKLNLELHGAPSELALLIFRGSGLELTMDNWNEKRVCSKHLDELLLQWNTYKYQHIHRRKHLLANVDVCSVPPLFGPQHKKSIRPKKNHSTDVLTFSEAIAALKKYGILLHPGIPLCKQHKEFFQEMISGGRNARYQEPLEFEEEPENEGNDQLTPRSHRSSNSPVETAVYELSKLVGVTRIKPQYPFDMLSKQSQTKKANSVKIVFDAIIKTVAPGSEEVLKSMIFGVSTKGNERETRKLHNLLTFVSEEYCSANNRQERNIVLSQVAKMLPFTLVSNYIPGLSFYMFDQARRTVNYTGITKKRPRTRFDPESVNLFLQFITSNLVMSPFTHGEKKARTTDGTLMTLPNTIRKQGHAQIVGMFKSHVDEIGLTNRIVLSDSTCFRILALCAATPLKAATCVDYFLAQALESRDELNSLFDLWEKNDEIDKPTNSSMQKQLENIIHYYRSDYRIHVKLESQVADHCCVHALSDPNDSSLSEKCSLKHDLSCDKCELAKNFSVLVIATIQKIAKRLEYMSKQKDADAKRKLQDYRHHEHAINRCLARIEAYKMHVLRSSYTDNERTKIINELKDDEALVTLDFAQKFLVQKHYETQKDYFGKRGMSYHVTHVLAKIEGHLAAHAIVHILRGDLQDTLAVTAMLHHSLKEMKQMGIKAVTLRSDNAGNYHCNQTISSLISLSEETGVQIKRYAYSEAQNGKSSCDRVASIVKRKVILLFCGSQKNIEIQLRNFVDQGHNVETVEDFMNALKENPIANTSVFLANVSRPKTNSKSEIKNISCIHDVHVSKKELIVRRYNGIGSGSLIPKKKLVPNKSKLTVEDHTTICASETLSSQDRSRLKNNEQAQYWHCVQQSKKTVKPSTTRKTTSEDSGKQNTFYFSCLEEGCTKNYRHMSNLEKHMEIGNHDLKPETVTLRDSVLHSYYNLANDIKENRLPKAITDAITPFITSTNTDTVKQGWALATRKAAKRFNEKQKSFLVELFHSGEEAKAKFDGIRVERIMKSKRDEHGNPYFEAEELLDFAQINSFFSRLAAKKKPERVESTKSAKRSQKPKRQRSKENEDMENEENEEDEEDENSPDYSLIGYKDAKFPDLLTEAQDIVRKNTTDLFDKPT